MTSRKRFGALVLCIGMAFILAVSAAFIIHEADHDCSGEDCPVCRLIAVNFNLLHILGLAAIAFLSFFFLLSRRLACGRRDRYNCFFSGTLVSWKVRLND
jgi:hypothetical protein